MMYFNFLYRASGLSRMHSTDLEDMRDAICDDEPDRRDGRIPPAGSQRQLRARAMPAKAS